MVHALVHEPKTLDDRVADVRTFIMRRLAGEDRELLEQQLSQLEAMARRLAGGA